MTEQLALTLVAASIGFVSAIFLCVGSALNSVEKIALLSTQFWDVSEPVARALSAQRAQYLIGGVLLFISFSFQICAALSSASIPAPLPQIFQAWQSLVLVSLIPTGLISWFACRTLDQCTIERVLVKHKETLAAEAAGAGSK